MGCQAHEGQAQDREEVMKFVGDVLEWIDAVFFFVLIIACVIHFW
jgi:hypothetical protein